MTRGVADHVTSVAIALNTALEVVRRKGESVPSREGREAKFLLGQMRRCRYTRLREGECVDVEPGNGWWCCRPNLRRPLWGMFGYAGLE